MKVTIIGTGHGGTAQAAVLAQKGFEVNLLKLGRPCMVSTLQPCKRLVRSNSKASAASRAAVYAPSPTILLT